MVIYGTKSKSGPDDPGLIGFFTVGRTHTMAAINSDIVSVDKLVFYDTNSLIFFFYYCIYIFRNFNFHRFYYYFI